MLKTFVTEQLKNFLDFDHLWFQQDSKMKPWPTLSQWQPIDSFLVIISSHGLAIFVVVPQDQLTCQCVIFSCRVTLSAALTQQSPS